MLAREMDDIDVRDNAGNTSLMYTVMGRQLKVLWSVKLYVCTIHLYTNTTACGLLYRLTVSYILIKQIEYSTKYIYTIISSFILCIQHKLIPYHYKECSGCNKLQLCRKDDHLYQLHFPLSVPSFCLCKCMLYQLCDSHDLP